MQTLEEKRVYADRSGTTRAYVASGMGVVEVDIADAIVGEFSLCLPCTANDIATVDDHLAVATAEDVLVVDLEADELGTEAATETGFGPAVAVGYADTFLIAADDDGRVARFDSTRDSWEPLTDRPLAAVRAIDGGLVGTDDGVYRVHGDGVDHAGLTDVRDVSATSVPLAATTEGLYKLGNGWMSIRETPATVVSADPGGDPGRLTRAHAVADGTVYEYDRTAADDGVDGGTPWHELEVPATEIIAFGYGETVYAVTADGTFLTADVEAGRRRWRTRTLGVRDVSGLAVAQAQE